ncbi:MAG: hypothetical protein AAF845_15370 [Bacteroidota bacterium]
MADVNNDRPEDDADRKTDDKHVDDVRRLNEEWEKAKRTGRQLGLGLPAGEAEAEDPDGQRVPSDVENPEVAYDLNYTIRRELMNNLPEGPRWKKLRDYIYEEKNIYLRGGKKKAEAKNGVIGADSRITYRQRQSVVLRAVREWSASGGTPLDIYMEFVDLNRKAGYRPKAYEGPLSIDGTLNDELRADVMNPENSPSDTDNS